MSDDVTRVLLVEDDPADALLHKTLLKDVGFRSEVVHAVDLASALAYMADRNFDVVLMDLNLPDSDGLHTVERVVQAQPSSPVILLTALRDEQLALTCLQTGAQDYLEKGQIDGQALVRSIRYARQRKDIEIALQRSEAEFRGLFENATIGILRSDRSGRLIDANTALVRMLGYETKEELLDLDVVEAVFVDATDLGASLREDGSGVDLHLAQTSMKRCDGELITVRLNGRMVQPSDGSTGFSEIMVEDITEGISLEDRLRQAEKMQVLGQLGGGVAHEINNILAVILANTGMVLSGLSGDDHIHRPALVGVQRVARRGAELVKHLLGFSRKQRLDLKDHSLKELVQSWFPMLRPLMPENVNIEFEGGETMGCVRVDSGAVQQILINLVTNARDAMPDGGTISISIDEEVIDRETPALSDLLSPGTYHCLRVADNGSGMDADTVTKIFEPFYTTKQIGQGTGIGLSGVYGLIKQQEGHVRVESTVGTGSVFEVRFPVSNRDVADEVPAPDSLPEKGAGQTILVAEDEPELRSTVERVLVASGYEVVVAEDGEAALNLYRELGSEVHLILSDVMMPVMTGPELYRMIHDETDTPPRFVFMSGYLDADFRGGSTLPEGVCLLEKPWEIPDLLSTIAGG